MARPSLAGVSRIRSDFRRFDLQDPRLDEPIVLFLRPLLDIEIDEAEEKAVPFILKHITGGWRHEITSETMKEPQPILIDGEEVGLTEELVFFMHIAEAMQRPMAGQVAPSDSEVIDVPYMVEMAVKTDAAWRAFRMAVTSVSKEGKSGKFSAVDSEKQPTA